MFVDWIIELMDTGRNKSNIISGGKISFFEREKVIGDKL